MIDLISWFAVGYALGFISPVVYMMIKLIIMEFLVAKREWRRGQK